MSFNAGVVKFPKNYRHLYSSLQVIRTNTQKAEVSQWV